jgi:hypothetical protein
MRSAVRSVKRSSSSSIMHRSHTVSWGAGGMKLKEVMLDEAMLGVVAMEV